MKKFFLSAFLMAGLGLGFGSCSNGDYDANPDTNNSGGVNPLNPTGGIYTDFNWGGTGPISLELNGEGWQADEAVMITLPDDDQHYLITGLRYSQGGDTMSCNFYLNKNTAAGQSVFVFAGNTDNTAAFSKNISDGNQMYTSTLSSLGEIKILENDATHIKGLFYFLARSPYTGQYINIQKGYFNVNKP